MTYTAWQKSIGGLAMCLFLANGATALGQELGVTAPPAER
jgi:hypothetical protein